MLCLLVVKHLVEAAHIFGCWRNIVAAPCNRMRLSIILGGMILLSAFKIDSSGRFSYRLEPAKGAPVATDNDKVVAKSLLSLGVERPDRLIAQARTWGSVEIIEPVGSKSLKKPAAAEFRRMALQ